MKPAGLIRLLALALACASCGAPAPDGVVGTWRSMPGGVTITITFTGTPAAGTVRTTQSAPVSGDAPTCHADLIGDGTYQVNGAAITIDTPSGHQVTAGCNAPDSDTPIADPTPLRNFAAALSGPFRVTTTQLTLGTVYPTMTRQ
jgi:hypothetical protein